MGWGLQANQGQDLKLTRDGVQLLQLGSWRHAGWGFNPMSLFLSPPEPGQLHSFL